MMVEFGKKNLSLCTSCARNITDCEWLENNVPVDGWVADRHELQWNWKSIYSYCVRECPRYTEDPQGEMLLNDDGIRMLAEAVVNQAGKDVQKKIGKRDRLMLQARLAQENGEDDKALEFEAKARGIEATKVLAYIRWCNSEWGQLLGAEAPSKELPRRKRQVDYRKFRSNVAKYVRKHRKGDRLREALKSEANSDVLLSCVADAYQNAKKDEERLLLMEIEDYIEKYPNEAVRWILHDVGIQTRWR